MTELYWFIVVVLYGAGMYMCGYRKALKKAIDDMKGMGLKKHE
jgi:hypothetical protein